jgi:hypothetical protein
MPIKRNSRVQTGPKTQLGGEKKGWCKPKYQEEILGVVTRAPRPPTI